MLEFVRIILGFFMILVGIGTYLFLANKYKPLKEWEMFDLIYCGFMFIISVPCFILICNLLGGLFI